MIKVKAINTGVADNNPDVEPFDVRPILAEGTDPFEAIMRRAEAVPENGRLVIDAPFNPSPLRRVMAGKGFSSRACKLAEGHWRVDFNRDGGADWQHTAEAEVLPEGALVWREEDGVHIDVRKLSPPAPMVAILRLLDRLEETVTVVVHHERVPHFLFPELAERRWRVTRMAEDFVNVRLWLDREGA